jgi:hypothetical protein
MKKQRNVLGYLQAVALITMYLFACGLLFLGGWYLINLLFPGPGAFMALYVIIFLLAGALIGAWLWVLIKLPQGLAKSFDRIKNKIAGGEITGSDDFSAEISRFLVEYFTFFRFDVIYAQFQVKNHDPIGYPAEFTSDTTNPADLASKSRKTEELIYLGKSNNNGSSFHGYIVPIWFGHDWLGYFYVLTDTRLNGIFRNFLAEFEEQYIDDQLMHVLHTDRMTQVQHMCRHIENFNSKIREKSFNNLEHYFEDLLDLLITQTGCKAGLITSALLSYPASYNLKNDEIDEIQVKAFDKTLQTGNEKRPLAFAKKINIIDGEFVVVLFDHSYESMSRARTTLESCLMQKIANQVQEVQKLAKIN